MKNYKRIISITLAICLCLSLACISFAGEPTGARSLFGDDNRYEVTSTSGRNLSIAKLIITYSDGQTEGGTGFLLSSTKVATAGHCLLKKRSNGNTVTATQIVLYFGCDGTNQNHTHTYKRTVNCTSSNTIVSSGWTGDSTTGTASNYDYGLIILSNPVSNPGNYFELNTISSPVGKSASILGYENHYENTAFYNWELVRGDGDITGSTAHKLETHIDAMPGQSGGPMINNNGEVIGIFAYGASTNIDPHFQDDDSTFVNKAVRVTNDMINFYNSY